MALTKAKLIELIDNGDIDVGGGGGQNILHNWDFRNPVNQRGVSGTISTGTYFYDRWLRNNGTVTTNAAYLTVGAAAVIEQRIEGNLLAGETVTVSVMVGGTVFSGTGTMPTSGTASVTLTGWGNAALGYATGYMYVRLSPTAASNVVRVKLEMGTVSTLAYDPPMDYGTELLKCCRYYQKRGGVNATGSIGIGYAITTTAAHVWIGYDTPMRIVPTLTTSGSFRLYHASGNYAVSALTVASGTTESSGLCYISAASTGMAAGTMINCIAMSGAYLALSADL